MKHKFFSIILVISVNLEALGTNGRDKAQEIFCQGVHTCLSSTTWRTTCSVDGYFDSREEADEYLREESCCEESLIDSVSIGFNITGCGTGAP